ncbi:hypothetical protein B0H17DRAFT_1331097 [Mycena rosella]|uniref:F-box domain-containing protein n=1 Tax=Mycena rosella TaxID=1033263 RepID=A0AAD7DJ45_MYCRO|nr:hypothetical protein B0H17DRAFT_1331097 [Mycena rosella]
MDLDVFVTDAQPGSVDEAGDDAQRMRGQDAEDDAQTLLLDARSPHSKPESSSPCRLSPPSRLSAHSRRLEHSSPLLTLPPELLTLIALHLATAPPNLGPPAALLPLLRTCRALHARLGFGGNPALWGRIGRAKFARASLVSEYSADGVHGNPLLESAQALRAHCVTLQTLRTGDPYARGAGGALVAAYTLLVQDSWGATPLSASQEGMGALPEALRPLRATATSGVEREDKTSGKNRKQLAWAGAREFAMRFVRLRLYEGRYGEEDDDDDADPAWYVGWPRDTAAGAAALWILWFFEGGDTLRAETEPARRAFMALLLPFVVALFRYPSTLCPPHHYSVPLLPAVASAALGAGREGRAITVPTLHGAYPIYPLKEERYDSDAGDSSGSSEGDDEDSDTFAPGRSRSGRSRSPPSRRRHSGERRAPGSTSAQRPPFRHPGSSPDSVSRRRRSRSPLPRRPSSARRRSRSPPFPTFRRRPSGSRRLQSSSRRPDPARTLLTAPPARLLFFARMQAGRRMGAPPHLAQDRAEAGARWAASGGTGPQPIGPTQEDVQEKNARPIVRFERQLPKVPLPPRVAAAGPVAASDDDNADADPHTPAASTSANGSGAAVASPAASPPVDPAALAAHAAARAEAEAERAVPFFAADEDLEDGAEARGNERWAAHAWRAKLCRGYGDPPSTSAAGTGAGAASTSTSTRPTARRRRERIRQQERAREEEERTRVGRGGAAPGRIGRVYELGSFAGLWAGTMLMPSEQFYTTLLSAPGGAFPRDGLVRDDFITVARPVYMRIAEHHSFHPHTPVPPPPPDSTTGDEGMRAGWLPRGARFLPLSANQIEIRVPNASLTPGAAPGSFEAQFGYADADMGRGVAMGGGVGGQRGEESVFVYESVPEGSMGRGKCRAEAHGEGCPGCVRVDERARWARGGGVDGGGDVEMEASPSSDERSSTSQERSSTPSSPSQDRTLSAPSSSTDDQTSSPNQDHSPSSRSDSSSLDSWPEWEAPAWAGHRFADDEGWEGACDGVQDVIFTGETDPRHGMAWHHYEYAGRVRPWDGLIGLVMRPRDRSLGLATYFISGHLIGRDTFEGTWQMAAQDVLAPSWGGSVCFARGEE